MGIQGCRCVVFISILLAGTWSHTWGKGSDCMPEARRNAFGDQLASCHVLIGLCCCL